MKPIFKDVRGKLININQITMIEKDFDRAFIMATVTIYLADGLRSVPVSFVKSEDPNYPSPKEQAESFIQDLLRV